jgi:hypothetical protein
MNPVQAALPPKQVLPKGAWLLTLAVIYGLVFFPGALFYRPPVLEQETFFQATELFLMFPKLLVFGLLVLLGFLEQRPQVQWRHPLIWLTGLHLLFVVISSINSGDELTYTLLGARGRFDGLIYQVLLSMFVIAAFTALQQQKSLLEQLPAMLVIGAVLQSVIVIGQYMSFDPLTVSRRWETSSLSLGLLAHPGMVAGLLLPCIVIAVIQAGEQLRQRPQWLFAVFTVSVGFSTLSNRSALLACLIALLLVLLLKRTWFHLALIAATLLACVYARSILPHPNALRVLQDTRTLETRLMMWSLTLKMDATIPGAPLIGGGSDALRLAQLRHPPLEELTALTRLELGWTKKTRVKGVEVIPGAGETERDQMLRFTFLSRENGSKIGDNGRDFEDYEFTWDKAHNFFLDRLIAYGLPDALLWLAFYLFPVYLVWRRGDTQAKLHICVILSVFGYYLTWFPVMQVEPLHIIMVLMLWATIQYAPSRRNTLEIVRAIK